MSDVFRTVRTQESSTPFQVDHTPDDHVDDVNDECYMRNWQRDFIDLGTAHPAYKHLGLLLSAFAKGDGSCIHPGNKALTYATGFHPVKVNKVVRDLIRDQWIEVVHKGTPTSPRVFALRHPEEHCG